MNPRVNASASNCALTHNIWSILKCFLLAFVECFTDHFFAFGVDFLAAAFLASRASE